jgi:hypothetical protein
LLALVLIVGQVEKLVCIEIFVIFLVLILFFFVLILIVLFFFLLFGREGRFFGIERWEGARFLGIS